MEILYSAASKGFYSREIHGDSMPSDCLPIEGGVQEHQQLLEGQAQGMFIVAGEDGYRKLAEPPPETAESVRAQTLAERDFRLSQAAIRIAPLQDAVDIDVSTAEDKARLLSWKKYRVALNRIEEGERFPLSVDWPAPPL